MFSRRLRLQLRHGPDGPTAEPRKSSSRSQP